VSAGTVDAIVVNASGCSQMIKEYAYALRRDPDYADKAARISALARDLCELLPDLVRELKDRVRAGARRLALHTPCTLQHGQRLRGVETQLAALGFDVRLPAESHL
jgi:glycolate oxidase iron-sulfur subunit